MKAVFDYLINLQVFGIIVTLAAYFVGVRIYKLFPCPLTHPMVIADALIICMLQFTNVTAEQYLSGAGILITLIVPATVVLALKVYRQRTMLREYALPIFAGCIAGAAASLVTVFALCTICSRFVAIDNALTMSLLPKSVTTAIAMELAAKHGGISGLAIAAVLLTGVSSAACMPFCIKKLHLSDRIARGVAMGASGHAVGTAAAIELGETEGAMSGIALTLTGIITSILFLAV
ncbi:MAG: LrgB family protein [Treponemataceae bacterium]|nr:MAG: LrgB family protein [Treponemataceae bacterium]